MLNWKQPILINRREEQHSDVRLVAQTSESESCDQTQLPDCQTYLHPPNPVECTPTAIRAPWRIPFNLMAFSLLGASLIALGIYLQCYRGTPLGAEQYWLCHDKYPPSPEVEKALSVCGPRKIEIAIARHDIAPGELITKDNVVIKEYSPKSKEVTGSPYAVTQQWQLWGRCSKASIRTGQILDARSISAEQKDSKDYAYFAVSSVHIERGWKISSYICRIPIESMPHPEEALTSSEFMDLVATEPIDPGTIIKKTQVLRVPRQDTKSELKTKK